MFWWLSEQGAPFDKRSTLGGCSLCANQVHENICIGSGLKRKTLSYSATRVFLNVTCLGIVSILAQHKARTIIAKWCLPHSTRMLAARSRNRYRHNSAREVSSYKIYILSLCRTVAVGQKRSNQAKVSEAATMKQSGEDVNTRGSTLFPSVPG